MDNTWILLLMGVINAPAFILLFNKLFPSKKDIAEVKNLSIIGENTTSTEWYKLYVEMKGEIALMRIELDKQKKSHTEEIAKKDMKISELEKRIQELEYEVVRTKSIKETIVVAKEAIHEAVDVVADQIINNNK